MASMAFPIPSHLPRKQDVSSKILNKIDSATYQSLNLQLTSTWLNELDETIQATKTRLHERIQSDLPRFQRQLDSANSIQTGLQALTSDVDALSATVSDPGSGLVPLLLQGLSEHSGLVQEAADIQVQYQSLSHVLRCKTEFSNLGSLVKLGRLPDAVVAFEAAHTLLESAPDPLPQSKIFLDFKRKHQSIGALIQEQLDDAYSRSIVVSPSHLVIRSSVQIRGSDVVLPLASILSSFISTSLDQSLTILRRDIVTHFIEYVLQQPSFVSIGSADDTEHSISLIPTPPNNENKSARIDNLAQILDFLYSRLFTSLPPRAFSSFSQSIYKHATTSILNMLLVPSLPSSFGLLLPFLDLAKRAVTFESNAVTQYGSSSTADLPIRAWVDRLASHYEKQRRLELLGNCRAIILNPENPKDRFQFEIEVPSESAQAAIVPVQEDEGDHVGDNDLKDNAWGFEDEGEKLTTVESVPGGAEESGFKDDAWGFDDEGPVETEKPRVSLPKDPLTSMDDVPAEDVDNGWGFEDEDMPPDEPEPSVDSHPTLSPSNEPGLVGDSDSAWGLNEDGNTADATGENVAWDDDPWSDPPAIDESLVEKPVVPIRVTSPKVATRLEKLANRGKKLTGGHVKPIPDPTPTPVSHPPAQAFQPGKSPTDSSEKPKRPPELKTNIIVRESLAVPDKAKQIVKAVENLIDECKQLQSSSLFPHYPLANSSLSPPSQPGLILAQTPASLVDLYIALYPVKFGDELSQSVQKGLLFSNGCLYLEHEIEEIQRSLPRSSIFERLKERLTTRVKRLRVLGESWHEQVVESQCTKVDEILVDGAKGFKYTSDQDRYDECEMAINQVVQQIKRFAQQLKGIVTKGKYYTAIGLVAEAALSRILEDILTLSDIPEVDSHQLGELCRILNSLEGLFSEDPTQPSFVLTYVPSWLKFNYLSELLEASMADISYLFEEGALVDFEIDELVRLVKALFADTALRTSMINKLMNGHPVPS